MNIKCKNLKIRIILKSLFDVSKQNLGFSIENKTNLFVIKSFSMKCVFVIYKHTLSTVHVTGIKDKNCIDDIKIFLKKYDLDDPEKIIVDNSLFSGRTAKQIDFKKIQSRLNEKYPFYSASFSEEVINKKNVGFGFLFTLTRSFLRFSSVPV
jgi:hypothetical protein